MKPDEIFPTDYPITLRRFYDLCKAQIGISLTNHVKIPLQTR